MRTLNKPIWIALAIFFIIYLFIILRLHFNYSTTDSDLAIFDQQAWFLSQFKLPNSSFKNGFNEWGDHFGLIEVFIAPIYWFWSSSVVLLILQTGSVVLSALPMSWLFKKHLTKSNFWTVLFISCYLLFFGFQSAIIFPFHTSTLGVVFIAFLLYAMLEEKWLLYWLMLVLTLITKEDLPLLGLVIGIYLVIRKKYWVGSLTLIFSYLYFNLVTGVIIPFFMHGKYGYFVSQLGNTPSEIVVNSIKNPLKAVVYFVTPLVKLRTMIVLFGSFGFFTLLSPTFLFLLAPMFAERFLNDTLQRHLVWMHYSATQGPLLAIGMIFGLVNIKKLLNYFYKNKFVRVQKNIVPIGVSMSLIFTIGITFYYKMPILNIFNPNFFIEPVGAKYIREALKLIPKNASVATQSGLQPHLSERDIILFYPDPARSTTNRLGDLPANATPDEYLIPNVDFLLISTEAFHWQPVSKDGMSKQIDYVKKQPGWEIVYDKGGTVLLKKRG